MFWQQLLPILTLHNCEALVQGIWGEAVKLSVKKLYAFHNPFDFEIVLIWETRVSPLEDVLLDRGRWHRLHTSVALKRGACCH